MKLSAGEVARYLEGHSDAELFERSAAVRREVLGTKVYLRGLIEISNHCTCNCHYCGIRSGAAGVERYELGEEEVILAASRAYEMGWGAVVIQGGEVHSARFVQKIARICRSITEFSGGKMAITLSLGVQSREVYELWQRAGARRYLLRIESSSPALFGRIHPPEIRFQERLEALETLIKLGYQTGSGVMLGLPGQSIMDIAHDLLWLQHSGIVMCGMGPYIPSPAGLLGTTSYSAQQRVDLTLRATAVLRLLMPRINIAASTALGTLSPAAKPRAMTIGANVLMPNITPLSKAQHYNLYPGKPPVQHPDGPQDLEQYNIEYHTPGTSLAFAPKGNISKS